MKKRPTIFLLLFILLITNLKSATFTVTSPSDGDGTAGDGVSMRWAINRANATAGHDIIIFNIGGTGVKTIQSAGYGIYPALTDNAGVTINGWSQTGWAQNTAPIGSASNAIYTVMFQSPNTWAICFDLQSDNNIIQGVVINGYGSTAGTNDCNIRINGNNNDILGCFIGISDDGMFATTGDRMENGVRIETGTGNTIGDGTPAGLNVISFNGTNNIYIASAGNSVKGNYIGTIKDLTQKIAPPYSDQDFGILLDGAAADNNVIGGKQGAVGVNNHGNRIAFHAIDGIRLNAASIDNLIARNLIYSNGGKGINLMSTGNTNYTKPTISAATSSSVNGTTSVTAPHPTDSVEIFTNTTGNCQDAMRYVRTVRATTSAWMQNTGITILPTESITATGVAAAGLNTSEFGCLVTPLPIELLNFNVNLFDESGPKVITKWSTASEINNDFFTIERSKYGILFEKINDDIDGAGNSTNTINYSDIDKSPLPGISYYRLKQTDYDGHYEYSNIVTVNNVKSEFNFDVLLSKDNLAIVYSSDESSNITIFITNSIGQIIYSINSSINIGGGVINTNLTEASGLYFVSVKYNNKNYTKKIVFE